MQYKIFLPGVSGSNDQNLRDIGLGDLCTDCGADWEPVPVGRGPDPDKSSGVVATWKADVRIDAPDGIPESYQWTACPPDKEAGIGKGAYWFGINPDSKPGPLELQRKTQLTGLPVELADEKSWSIPIARGMPYKVSLDYETGEPVAKIDDRFTSYTERAFRHASLLAEREEDLAALNGIYFGTKLTDEEMLLIYAGNKVRYEDITSMDALSQELSVAVLFEEALEQSVRGLSLNYRLNQFMILHLELLEVSTYRNHLRDICLAAIEAGTIIESLKKNEQGRTISLIAG